MVESQELATLHHIVGGAVVKSVPLTVEGTFELSFDDDVLTVRSGERTGHRWSQRFTSDLEPLEEPVEILLPIRAERHGADMTINGRVVSARRLWVWGDHVAGARKVERDEDAVVDVYDAGANRVTSIRLPGVWVSSVAVTSQGVLIRSSDRVSGAKSVQGYDWTGGTFEIDTVPEEPARPGLHPREPIPFGEMSVVREGLRMAVRDAQGRHTAAVPVRGQIGVRGDRIEVARPDGRDRTKTVVKTYRCGGEPVGVPMRWVP